MYYCHIRPKLSHFHIFNLLPYNKNQYYLLPLLDFDSFFQFIFNGYDPTHIFYNLILLLFFLVFQTDQIKNFSKFNLSYSIIEGLTGLSFTLKLFNHQFVNSIIFYSIFIFLHRINDKGLLFHQNLYILRRVHCNNFFCIFILFSMSYNLIFFLLLIYLYAYLSQDLEKALFRSLI